MEMLFKCATEVARLYRVSKKSCTQVGRLRKLNRAREIEFNFLSAWIISCMKIGTPIYHAHEHCLRLFNFAQGLSLIWSLKVGKPG